MDEATEERRQERKKTQSKAKERREQQIQWWFSLLPSLSSHPTIFFLPISFSGTFCNICEFIFLYIYILCTFYLIIFLNSYFYWYFREQGRVVMQQNKWQVSSSANSKPSLENGFSRRELLMFGISAPVLLVLPSPGELSQFTIWCFGHLKLQLLKLHGLVFCFGNCFCGKHFCI